MSVCGGSTFTGPCHLPARAFSVSKDFCAPEGANCSVALCASDCAKATLETDIRTKSSRKRMNLIVCFSLCVVASAFVGSLQLSHVRGYYAVIANYNTMTRVKSFFGLCSASQANRWLRGSFFPGQAVRHGDDVDGWQTTRSLPWSFRTSSFKCGRFTLRGAISPDRPTARVGPEAR